MKTPHFTAFALAALFAIAAVPAEAATKQQIDGLRRCTDWCMAHNKTQTSFSKCANACYSYWSTHLGIGPTDPGDTPNIGGDKAPSSTGVEN